MEMFLYHLVCFMALYQFSSACNSGLCTSMTWIAVLAGVFMLLVGSPKSERLKDTEIFLRTFLLSESRYSTYVRPKLNRSESVSVHLTWDVMKIIGVDDKLETFTHAADLAIQWTDERLIWNPDNYKGIENIIVKGRDIWTPYLDILSRGEFGLSFLPIRNDQRIQVDYKGNVRLGAMNILTTMCDIDPRYFPYDIQTCSILINSKVFNKNEMHLQLETGKSGPRESSSWALEEVKVLGHESHLECVVCAELQMTIRRKPLFHVFTMVMPASIISVLVIISFLIPADEGERISCGMTIFLSYVVFLSQYGEFIPENSNSLTVIGIYFMLLMISSSLLVIDTVVLVYAEKKFQEAKDQPSCLCTCRKTTVGPDKVVQTSGKNYKLTLSQLFHFLCFALSLTSIVTANVLLIVAKYDGQTVLVE